MVMKISQAGQAEVSAFRDGAQHTFSQGQTFATIACMTWSEKLNCPEIPVTKFLHLKPALLCPSYNTHWTLKAWVASICKLSKLNSALTFHSSHKELSFHQGSVDKVHLPSSWICCKPTATSLDSPQPLPS